MYAQDLVILLLANNLYKAFFFAEDARLAEALNGNLPTLTS